MTLVSYKLRLKGLSEPDGQISVLHLVELLSGLTKCAERTLRLAAEGTSTRPGPPPAWVTKGTDWIISGIEKGSTILTVQAPPLSSFMDEQIKQQDFWNSPPSPDDTALSLLTRTLEDTKDEKLESPNFDSGVLKSILALKTFFRSDGLTLELSSSSRKKDKLSVGRNDIDKAEKLQRRTPDPRVFVIAGHLDKIAHRDRAFQLEVEDGKKLVGRIDAEFLNAEALRQFWGQKVSVKGLVHFHPSGKVQLVEAQAIHPWEKGDEVFAQVPLPVETALLPDTHSTKSSQVNPFHQVRGQWPGDESIDVLLEALRGN